MKVTIKDIAREAGVSISTVSLALSGKDSRLAEVTKQKILDTAKSLNYRRNHLASGLITKKTYVLGVILPDISNEFFAKMAKGIGAQAEKNDYRIMLIDANESPKRDLAAIHTLLERRVDGILYVHSAVSKSDHARECIALCKDEATPIVLLDRVPESVNGSAHTVMADQELGGYMATNHLLDLGHTRIGCITGSVATGSSRKRLLGYIKALRERGIPTDTDLIIEGEYNAESGYKLTQSLLDQGVTAIFAFNDLIAYGVYKYARDKNINMPGNLSLIGFDDINFSEIMELPLTTIRQPAYEIGKAAVQKMLHIINKEACEQASVFEPLLIVRKSTTRPKGVEHAKNIVETVGAADGVHPAHYAHACHGARTGKRHRRPFRCPCRSCYYHTGK